MTPLVAELQRCKAPCAGCKAQAGTGAGPNKKILQDLFTSGQYKELLERLFDINQKNKDIFFSLSKEFVAQSILLSETEITSRKIIWLNSYLDQDLDYISSFIDFYMSNKYQLETKIFKYEKVTPEEIALSILAGLTQLRRKAFRGEAQND